MSNQSTTLSSSVTGKGARRLKENDIRSEEDLKMQVRKKICHLIRILM